MNNNTGSLIILVAMLVFVIPAVLVAGRVTEPFNAEPINAEPINAEPINAGEYPCAVSQLPLADSYKVVDNPGYTNNSAQDIYKDYPTFMAKHFGTNNVRYWSKPTNGMCTPPGICGGLYATTEQNIPPQPVPPSWNQEPRVNFYVVKL